LVRLGSRVGRDGDRKGKEDGDVNAWAAFKESSSNVICVST
jgi:hypothetical protein